VSDRQTNEAEGRGQRPLPSGRPQPHRTGPATERRANRYRLRNWPLRSKQIIVILVPTLTAALLGYLRISTELAKADEFGRTVTQVDLSATIARLVHDLQGERDLVVGRVASGRTGDIEGVTAQIDNVDRGVDALRQAADSIGGLDSAVRDRYAKVVAGLDTLRAVRAAAEQTFYPAADTLFIYGNVVGSLLGLNREITRVSDDRTISEQAARIDAIAGAKEQVAIQNAILRAAALSNSFSPDQLSRLRSAQAEFAAELAAFQEAADPAALTRYNDTVAGPEVDDRLRLQQIALNRGDADLPVDTDVGELDAAANGTLNKLRLVETASLADLRDTAQDLITTARNNAVRDALFIATALVLALLLMLVVARSLLKPLRVLRRDALEVANHRLPTTVQRILADPDPLAAAKNAVRPVPVFTTEEVGQVARSFDAVQLQAVRMATEQALLRENINSIFVNLSRRSQTLVERQLGLIDQLEHDEQDPDQLANLFELDHLATRMRRNSESLLVLSGSGLTRTLNQPVLVSEVVGAALSEVEQYARIDVGPAPEVLVLGRAVSDLVHLIAELLDNATYFSEPDKKVRVRIAVARGHDLIIKITDSGVGMSEAEIRSANERLADPPDLDVSVTRRMGLYVVARLAKKHGIAVLLWTNEDIEGGLVARITVPAELITFGQAATTVTQPPVHTTGPYDPLPTRTSGISAAFGSGLPRSRGELRRSATRPAPAPPPAEVSQPLQRPPVLEASMPGSPLFEAHLGATPRPDSWPAADPPTERLPLYEAVLSQWFAADAATSQPMPATQSWTSAGDDGWRAARTLLGNEDDNASVTSTGLPKRMPRARLIPGSAAPNPAANAEQARVMVPQRSALTTRARMASFQQGARRGRYALDSGGRQGAKGEQQ
jgi:signal transduction histidine kinase